MEGPGFHEGVAVAAEGGLVKAPGFNEGLAVAAVASIAGSAIHSILPLFLPPDTAMRFTVVGLGLGYLLYLLARSPVRVGRVLALAVWAAVAVGTWLWSPPWPIYLAGHLGTIWLIRSFCFHGGVLAALADLILNTLAVALAFWALTHTGSGLIVLWCFFLVQALFAFIPQHPVRRQAGPTRPSPETAGNAAAESFETAHRVAETALRALASKV